jgi:probable F420-dependent oxidoreductase
MTRTLPTLTVTSYRALADEPIIGAVKYYISTGYLDTREIVEIAKTADELGYDGLGIPDHVVNLETLATPYPYTRDGSRRWAPFTDWPDPWVLIGSLAQYTARLRFVTTVYVAALRDPYSAAKAIGTAAFLADGRVELGLGVGWCAEEFALLNARFERRGRRTDELIELMRALWSPGWTEFDGEFYSTPRLEMSPTPPPIPVWVGGLTDIALRRAARYDGWVGDLITIDDAVAVARRLQTYRDEQQRSGREFAVLAPLVDAFTPEDYERAERGGVTHTLTMPWMFYSGRDATLAEKVDGMKRFRDDLGLDRQR